MHSQDICKHKNHAPSCLECHPRPTQPDSWEERFEKAFGSLIDSSQYGYVAGLIEDFKAFVKSEITRAREEGAEKAVDELYEKTQLDIKNARQSERERIIGVIKRNKRCFYAASNPKLTEECRIWDSALDNLLEELKK